MARRLERVLILTLSFGSGHVQAARAIGAELTRQAPDADVRTIDALAGCRRLFRAGYVLPYWAMIRYAPWLWRRCFASRLAHLTRQTAPRWAFRLGCPAVFEAMASFSPDVIVAVEVAACEMAAIARASHLTSASVVSVITDYHAEPAWVQPEVDAYLVADEAVAEQLRSWGAMPGKIVVTGIPVETRVSPRQNDADGRPVVLLMGGGMGPTRIDEVARALCAGSTPMQVVAIAGYDHRARRRLQHVRGTALVSLDVLGWVDDVPALMGMASLLVTKPGGVTAAEAAVHGLPLVMFDPVPGPEESNAARIANAGAGLTADGPAAAAKAVIALLRDEPRRRAMSAAARALARPFAAGEAAGIVLSQARRRAGPERPERAAEIGIIWSSK
ncbi:MAG TPA: glycosyltransferase [Vicinamibacterales bacterium]|jgi:processive 1,2-diacylglycerol beta-glucosyltransferase|nr:glycosyltransferase [Vicinamibacterales bacterium]